jgi:hypothetical protein
MEENIWVYVCFSTILMIENILGMFVSLNNLDDVKLLGMFVSSTILMMESLWVCLFLNNFDGGKDLGMFVCQQF